MRRTFKAPGDVQLGAQEENPPSIPLALERAVQAVLDRGDWRTIDFDRPAAVQDAKAHMNQRVIDALDATGTVTGGEQDLPEGMRRRGFKPLGTVIQRRMSRPPAQASRSEVSEYNRWQGILIDVIQQAAEEWEQNPTSPPSPSTDGDSASASVQTAGMGVGGFSTSTLLFGLIGLGGVGLIVAKEMQEEEKPDGAEIQRAKGFGGSTHDSE